MEALYYYIPLISLMFLAISIFTDYFFHKLRNLPPRPWLPPLPIIGHLYLLNKPLHRSLAKVSAKHGPIQLLQFGSRRVLVVSSPSIAEECLTKNDIVFANRPQLLAGKYLGYNYTSLVFAPYGDHWRNLRRISSLEIFSSHRLTEFEPIRADEVRHMMCKLYQSSLKLDPVVHVRPMLVDLTLNVVMRMISGKRYYYSKDDVLIDEEKEKAHRFQEIVTEILKLVGATNIGDHVPMLRWLGVSKLEKRLIALQAKRDLFMQELLEELKENMDSNGKQRKNMIQKLLSLQNSEPELYTDELIRSMTLVNSNKKILYFILAFYTNKQPYKQVGSGRAC
ncbi:putative isoflavone 2'-hydroxylase [Helianthus annuus]|nr:putative isoflavone 2'-hydroxylase [Helianthus annuus]KAJ0760339.1 putative isoflavone 2'-hydroxylase [Helianthus annuus]